MRHHLGRQFAHALARKAAIEHETGATGKIEPRIRRAFVHRQRETVAGDAALVAECPPERLADRQAAVLDGVVFVDVGVALATQPQGETTMLAELFQHVVEEPDAGGNFGVIATVEVDANRNAGLSRHALDLAHTRIVQQAVRDFGPVHPVRADAESTHAEVARELHVGGAVAHHRGIDAAPAVVGEMVAQHARAGFAGIAILVFETAVDQHFAEADALRRKDAQQQLLRATKIRFRETRAAEPVLVGHHHQVVTGRDATLQRRDDTRHQVELFEVVELLVARLDHEAPITIDEQQLAAHAGCSTQARRTWSTRSFSAGAPSVRRNASPRLG